MRGVELLDHVTSTVRALEHVTGITRAAAAMGPLLDNTEQLGGTFVRIADRRLLLPSSQVTPSYFDVAGTRLLAGRALQTEDRGWSAIVVNESFARRLWPATPLEQIVGSTLALADGRLGQVVGVVQDTYDRALDQSPVARVFRPIESDGPMPMRVNYVLRLSSGRLNELAIRRAVSSVAPAAAVEEIDSIDGRLASTIRDRSFATLILTLFAAAGTGVTAAGIFAMVAFTVARRTRELAVRMAIGADAWRIRRLVMNEAVGAALGGITVGLIAARGLSKALESQLYGVTAGDLVVPGGTGLLMLAVAAVAAWWPARRAVRLEPATALRVE
jgi:hypothetical protein